MATQSDGSPPHPHPTPTRSSSNALQPPLGTLGPVPGWPPVQGEADLTIPSLLRVLERLKGEPTFPKLSRHHPVHLSCIPWLAPVSHQSLSPIQSLDQYILNPIMCQALGTQQLLQTKINPLS